MSHPAPSEPQPGAPIEVPLNYAPQSDGKPEVSAAQNQAGGRAPRRPDRRHVAMHDARAAGDALSLDGEGVILRRLASEVVDFYDADEVRRVYYAEVEALVREETGASHVHVFDHNVRSRPRSEKGEPGIQGPVKFAHNDYTVMSGPQRVRDLLPADEAEDRLGRRFAVINVWKPIRGPVQDTPLAVCDARSIAMEHLVPTNLVYADRVGEVYSLLHDPGHRWLYFPEQRADEAMLIKCYDSADDGRARFTCHSAFSHPGAPPDALPRESVEVRTLAFFDA